jgi:hypothetical protein
MKIALWILNITFIGVLLYCYGSVDTVDFIYLTVLNACVYALVKIHDEKKRSDELMIINPNRRWK